MEEGLEISKSHPMSRKGHMEISKDFTKRHTQAKNWTHFSKARKTYRKIQSENFQHFR